MEEKLENQKGENKKSGLLFWQSPLIDTIASRIMGFSVFILLALALVFEMFYYTSIKSYYYDIVAGTLTNQASYNADLYLTYLSNEDLNQVVVDNKNQFYRSDSSQVQILSNSGTVLYDSIGTDQVGKLISTVDVKKAQEGQSGLFRGEAAYTTDEVMSVSVPLHSQNGQVGILRLTTSLTKTNELIGQKFSLSVYFAIGTIIVGLILSFWLSRSITKPVEQLTRIARKIADGQTDVMADETGIGEIGELGRAMNIMSENIRQKERIKNDFISSVSHELRTPLTSIKGWALTLQSEGMGQDVQKEGLKIIEKESERLNFMVEDLLDFSRFLSGRIDLNKTKFDLIPVANNLVAQLRPRIRDKQLDVVYHYSQPQIDIVADENRVKQMMLNILDNAIKFTPSQGTIFIEITQEKDWVDLSITDTGIGISEKEIAFVTEKFWKGSSSQSHSGLGLSICEEIAKAHGGSLMIKSTVNVGTTVTIELPVENA